MPLISKRRMVRVKGVGEETEEKQEEQGERRGE